MRCQWQREKTIKRSISSLSNFASVTTNIISKDIDDIIKDNVEMQKFLRESIGVAFNFSTLTQCEEWFKCLCIVLFSKYYNYNLYI